MKNNPMDNIVLSAILNEMRIPFIKIAEAKLAKEQVYNALAKDYPFLLNGINVQFGITFILEELKKIRSYDHR